MKQTSFLPGEYSEDFERWWLVVWRKVAKQQAFKEWMKQRIEGDSTVISMLIADTEKRNRMNFWHPNPAKQPHPATFLSGRRWEDEGWIEDLDKQRKATAMGDKASHGPSPKQVIEETADQVRHRQLTEGMDGYDCGANRFMLRWLMFCARRGRRVPEDLLPQLCKYKQRAIKQMREICNEELENQRIAGVPDAQIKITDDLLEHFGTVLRDNFDRVLQTYAKQNA